MGRDSELYCKKCKHRKDCTFPCYPVEHLLDSITVEFIRPPQWYVDAIRGAGGEFPSPPRSWTDMSTPRKVFELVFNDGVKQSHVASIVGCSQQRVSQIIVSIRKMIDEL